MSKTKKAKLPKLPKPWGLFRSSWSDYRAGWKRFILILAIVAVPINLIPLFNFSTAAASIDSYTLFATIFMNVALIWAIVERDRSGKVPSLSHAYYDSSIAIIRFILVTLLLVLMLLPAALGATLLDVTLAAGQVGP